MIRTVIIGSQKIKIDQQNVLGTGGEATVVRNGNSAIKIYHVPDNERAAKLKDFCGTGLVLPNNVCGPQDIAYDTSGKIVGFSMPLIPYGQTVVQELSRKSFRKANPKCQIDFIIRLGIHAYNTTEQLHKAGVIVGDYNDLNFLFSPTNPYIVFIDVDSYQIGKHPCRVGTEQFLDPNLYDLDLSAKPYFKTENDWYSFWCILIKSLIMCHPYGGIHNDYKTLPQRALAKVTAFDSGVVYPKSAMSPDLLNKGLMEVVDAIFRKGKRYKPELAILEEYRDSLVLCNSCGTMFPSEKSQCPQCTKTNTQQIHRKIQVTPKSGKRTVVCEELMSTNDEFVWHRINGAIIYAISLKGSTYTLLKRGPSDIAPKTIGSIKSPDPLKFNMFRQYLAVNASTESKIDIWDTETMSVVNSHNCGNFHGIRTFGCTPEHLIRTKDGWMYKGSFDASLGIYLEHRIASVMNNQTWFTCSPNSGYVLGFQRFFHNYQFFLYRFDRVATGEFFDVGIPQIDLNESMLDVSIKFDTSAVLCMIKTEVKGKTYTKVYIINTNDGSILSQYQVPSLSSDTHRNIHGKTFKRPHGTKGIILHATDNGLVQEVIGGKSSLLTETEPYVSEDDSISTYKHGVIVVSNKFINYLTIT